MPPASISAATPVGPTGRSTRVRRIEPNAQLMVAAKRMTAPGTFDEKSPSMLSRATPAMPTPRPHHSRRLGQRPKVPPMTAVHSGIAAAAVAARPEPIPVDSATVTNPTPPTTSRAPSSTAARHWRRSSRAYRRAVKA